MASSVPVVLFLTLLILGSDVASASRNFTQHFDITWGKGRGQIQDGGRLLTLSLDQISGSGFQSKNQYLFGKIDMQLKLVPGNSAGTVTAYYLSADGPGRDEIDYEFLGNLTGDPYTIHTNVYTRGKGDREQQFRMWFDPTRGFHTYSILWNPHHILFSVDGTPIRDFRNHEADGIPFPTGQPMRLYSSLWNADDWATRGGLVKTDWSKAPFVASYRGFEADACVVYPGGRRRCGKGRKSNSGSGPARQGEGSAAAWWREELDARSKEMLRKVRDRYMVYDYCRDAKRFPQGFPPECSME